jgi:hypothetical protein
MMRRLSLLVSVRNIILFSKMLKDIDFNTQDASRDIYKTIRPYNLYTALALA